MTADAVHPIVIVGGGFIGPLMALALEPKYGPIYLIDPTTLDHQFNAPSDGRAIAITQTSKDLFIQLGLWSRLQAEAQPLLSVITKDESGSEMRMTTHDTFGKPLGYLIDSKFLKETILREAHKRNTITFMENQVQHLEYQSPFQSSVTVHLANGESILSSLVIGADGARSKVRLAANMRTYQWGYDQTAFVRVYQHRNSHQGQAYEKFLQTGPFAILPLRGNASSIVWAVPPEKADYLKSLSSSEFDEQSFQHMTEYRGLTPYSPVRHFPLSGMWVPFFTTHRIALIGDAAHQIHPLAGQGFNLGVHDVAALAETLKEGVSLGLDIGSQTLLKRYEQKQRWRHLSLLGATHGLNRLFSNDDAILEWIRTKGMALVENTPSLKRFFLEHGTGIKQQNSTGIKQPVLH